MPETTHLTCSQCGGELHPDEGQIFITCPYCAATVFLDKTRVVFHWSVAPTLDDNQALAALYRWMSGSHTVKDLDKKARVVGQSFQYFPVWYLKRGTPRGEEVLLRPAAATSVTEISALKLPAGDLKKYDPALDVQSAPPTVPLEAALEWAAQGAEITPASTAAAAGAAAPAAAQGEGGFSEAALVHVPLYFFKYAFRDATYTAVVDAASGTVLASLFPPKQEAPYRVVGVAAALVYLCLAVIPLGFAFSSPEGAATGMAICSGAGLLAAPLLFAWAFWVASRV